MTSCLAFSCPSTERKEESPDGLMEEGRWERLVLLIAEMIRLGETGRDRQVGDDLPVDAGAPAQHESG